MLGDLSCIVVFLRVGLVVVGAVHAPLPSFPHLALIYLHFHFGEPAQNLPAPPRPAAWMHHVFGVLVGSDATLHWISGSTASPAQMYFRYSWTFGPVLVRGPFTYVFGPQRRVFASHSV